MKLNYDDDQRKPLKGALNETKQDNETTIEHNESQDGGDRDANDEKRRKYIKYGIFGGIGLIILVLAIVLPLTLGGKKKPDDPIPKPVLSSGQNPYYVVPDSDRPRVAWARTGLLVFDPERNDSSPAKSLISEDTARILMSEESFQQTKQIGVNWTATLQTGVGNDIKKSLRYSFDMIDMKVARFELTDADSDRFSIPDEFVERPETNKNLRMEMVGHQFNRTESHRNVPFGFHFVDNVRPDVTLISTEGQSLIFSDKYIQMDFLLPSNQVTGFGERLSKHRLGEGAWGMWATGTTSQDSMDNARGRGGHHGVHPFLLIKTKEAQKYIGMYFRNANAQLPIIRYGEKQETYLSYIALGGQIEVYFFISGSAKEVIQDYQRIFGKPQLPPFWALGWQEASQTVYNATYDADNQLNLMRTVAHYREKGLPLDAVYLDQHHMNKQRNFDVDPSMISNTTILRRDLNNLNVKLVAYLDSTIIAPDDVTLEKTKNPTYFKGNQSGLFIKSSQFTSANYSNNLLAVRNLQKCVYVDWFKSDKAFNFWSRELQDFHKIVEFDGVWTTNNEAYSDVQGELNLNEKVKSARSLQADNVNQYDTTWFTAFEQKTNSTFYLPFIPEFATKGPYDANSISLNATHSDFEYFSTRSRKWEKRNESEFNLHSLYGHAMIATTYRALNDLSFFNNSMKDRRPFIVTRATFTGTNQYASYPIRSRYRQWSSLKQAIPHVMSMNMFGFTHTGVDACGTVDHPNATRTEMDEELCLRWIQLATFFPLARHSQDFHAKDAYLTGPLGFKTDSPRFTSLKKTMRDRMQYLRFMYTCLFESHQWGGSCFDPIYFHYSLDLESQQDVTGTNDTFMFGGSVKVSPVLQSVDANTKTFKSHFPKGRWLNLANMNVIDSQKDGEQDLDAHQDTINVHLRPGSIIPMQDLVSKDMLINNTQELMGVPITVVVNRNENKTAKGTLFLDDGISKSEITKKSYEYYTIEHKQRKAIQFSLQEGLRGMQDDRHHLEKIIIGDAEDLAGSDFACAFTSMNEIIELDVEYYSTNKTLTIYRPTTFDDSRLVFSKVSNIFYGQNSKDLNLCNRTHYEYKLDPETNLDKLLVEPSATMRLIHKGGILPDLNLTVRMFDEGIVNVKWTWLKADNGRRQHPEIPDILVDTSRRSPQSQAVGRHVIIQADPFLIKFTVQQGQTDPLFEIDKFVYDCYFNWVGMTALSKNRDTDFRGVMGLGERTRNNLFYQDGVYSMWAYDQENKNDDGNLPGKNSYGVHPFFMFQHSADKWVGVFSKQAQAQDWVIQNYPADGKTGLKQISTGGISDFYVIINSNSPDSVIGYYQRIVGKPVLMPQWSLGWHQCKWCLRSLEQYRDVIDNYAKHNIPLDGQWGDVDYMHNYQNFRVDDLYFGDLKSYVDELYHNETRGIKFIPIVDASIAVRSSYSTYQNGEKQNVFLKNANDGGKTLIAKGWANDVAFPDFFAPNTQKWWHSELSNFQNNSVYFDGLWLDMNEASNFCNGACYERQKMSASVADKFYYTPTGRNLELKSLPIDTEHADSKYRQLDTHNYYGAHQIAVTHDWFKQNSTKRPFIIGRSTFAGTGKYAGKWLGDSKSTFADMQRSVTGSMMMNMFGIPFVGGDICGFSGDNSSPYLCTRWHQVGAFQPFSRNHRDCDGKPQEPYRFINTTIFGGNVTMTDLMRKAIYEKYSLIRYYYTHLFLLSQDSSTNGAFYKPMFFEFPNLAGSYRAAPSENVMLGPSLKLSIKTSENKNWEVEKHDFYFPAGKWCDILHPETECVLSKGDDKEMLASGIADYHLHLREGHIIPFQNASALKISKSEDLQKHPVDLHINPKDNTKTNRTRIFSASGVYVNDNGQTKDQVGTYNKYSISFSYNDIVDGKNDDETIVMRVSVKDQAFKSYSNETKCSTINQNDILGGIYIYDEYGMFQRRIYQVMILRPDGTYDLMGVATYDKHTNRMIYTGYDKPPETPDVCLSYIDEIIFVPPVA